MCLVGLPMLGNLSPVCRVRQYLVIVWVSACMCRTQCRCLAMSTVWCVLSRPNVRSVPYIRLQVGSGRLSLISPSVLCL